jgi:hypothetical protein
MTPLERTVFLAAKRHDQHFRRNQAYLKAKLDPIIDAKIKAGNVETFGLALSDYQVRCLAIAEVYAEDPALGNHELSRVGATLNARYGEEGAKAWLSARTKKGAATKRRNGKKKAGNKKATGGAKNKALAPAGGGVSKSKAAARAR